MAASCTGASSRGTPVVLPRPSLPKTNLISIVTTASGFSKKFAFLLVGMYVYCVSLKRPMPLYKSNPAEDV